MQVKIKVIGDGKMPTKATKGSAAFDVYARCQCSVVPSRRVIIPLGFAIELPEGYCAKILPRSSTGLKTEIRMANSVGVIDADYRNEVGFIAEAKSGGYALVQKGERIGQMLIEKVEDVELLEVDELSETDRKGGFGSSGRF